MRAVEQRVPLPARVLPAITSGASRATRQIAAAAAARRAIELEIAVAAPGAAPSGRSAAVCSVRARSRRGSQRPPTQRRAAVARQRAVGDPARDHHGHILAFAGRDPDRPDLGPTSTSARGRAAHHRIDAPRVSSGASVRDARVQLPHSARPVGPRGGAAADGRRAQARDQPRRCGHLADARGGTQSASSAIGPPPIRFAPSGAQSAA
jgi:hypothetical protein